jgi:Type III restriction enzyme, res subunit
LLILSTLRQIKARLSLRPPQADSLDILEDILERIEFGKHADPVAALAAIQAAWSSVTDFERDFPSLCFALATGVGKTRLMGAFISYLYLSGRSRNFFVLAPNTTIYDKLVGDFTPNTEKYVFKGIAEFAQIPPILVTGDTWDQGRGVRGGDLFGRETAIVNIFNPQVLARTVRNRRLRFRGRMLDGVDIELQDAVILVLPAHALEPCQYSWINSKDFHQTLRPVSKTMLAAIHSFLSIECTILTKYLDAALSESPLSSLEIGHASVCRKTSRTRLNLMFPKQPRALLRRHQHKAPSQY